MIFCVETYTKLHCSIGRIKAVSSVKFLVMLIYMDKTETESPSG